MVFLTFLDPQIVSIPTQRKMVLIMCYLGTSNRIIINSSPLANTAGLFAIGDKLVFPCVDPDFGIEPCFIENESSKSQTSQVFTLS